MGRRESGGCPASVGPGMEVGEGDAEGLRGPTGLGMGGLGT